MKKEDIIFRSMFIRHRIIFFFRNIDFPGFRRLSVFLPKLLLPSVKNVIPHFLKTLERVLIWIEPSEDVGVERSLYNIGTYEAGTLAFIKEHLNPGDTYIDVGANIGWHALVAAKAVGPDGAIWCFEPSPRMFNILEKNIDANDFKNAHCFQCGIGNKNEEVKFYLNDQVNRGESSAIVQMDNAEEIVIHVLPLDKVLSNQSVQPQMIKIDVEGMEDLVLEGASETLSKHKPKLIVEVSNDKNPEKPHRQKLLEHLLSLEGYVWFKSKRGKERTGPYVPVVKLEDFPFDDNVYGLPKK